MGNFKPHYQSHRDDQRQGGTAPTQAHMALLTGQLGDPDALLAIPEGTHLFFISDPRRADGVTEAILQKVVYDNYVLKEIRLVAYSRDRNSTRVLILRANWEGQYKSAVTKELADTQKMLDSSNDKPK